MFAQFDCRHWLMFESLYHQVNKSKLIGDKLEITYHGRREEDGKVKSSKGTVRREDVCECKKTMLWQ